MNEKNLGSGNGSNRSFSIIAACILGLGLTAIWLFAIQTQPVAADPIYVGLITEGASVNSSLYDWLSYQGLLRAQDEFGIVGKVYTSTSDADYAPNLIKCVGDGNQLCVSVSFSSRDAISATARLYPNTSFAIVDNEFDHYTPNLRGITFRVDEGAYLAGVLSSRMTSSNILGVIGGMEIPSVLLFTNAYQHGAMCANPNVTTLITYTNNFGDAALGAVVAQDMIQNGADVIFPPAGGTGLGAILTATQSAVWGIGYDTDMFYSLFMSGTVTGSQYLLTSVEKRLDSAVFLTISDIISGTFTAGTKSYGIVDNAVGLAPFHDADSAIPGEVKREMEWLKGGIISGWVDLNTGCPTQVFLPYLQN